MGLLTKASTSPVLGSKATKAPRRVPNMSSINFCNLMSMDSTTTLPGVDGLLAKLRAGDVGTTAGLGAGAMGVYGLAREAMKPKEDRQFGNVALDAALGGALGAAGPAMAQAYSNSPPAAARTPSAAAVPPALAAHMQPGPRQPLAAAADQFRANIIDPVKKNVFDPAVGWLGDKTQPAVLGGAASAGIGAYRALVPRGDSSALQAGYKAVQSGKAKFPIPLPADAKPNMDAAQYAERVQADMGKAFDDLNNKSVIGRHYAATRNARKGLSFMDEKMDPATRTFAKTPAFVGGSQDTAREFSRRLMGVGRQQPAGRLGSALAMIPAIAGGGWSLYEALTQ